MQTQSNTTQDTPSELLLSMACRKAVDGAKWLDKRAKSDPRFVGWRLQMMSIHGGHVISHVHFEQLTREPLALALKHCPEFADPLDGRVKGHIVREKLGMSDEQALHFGFIAVAKKGKIALGDHDEDCPKDEVLEILEFALDYAWAEVLGEHRSTPEPDVLYGGKVPEPPMGFLAQMLDAWIKSSPGGARDKRG